MNKLLLTIVLVGLLVSCGPAQNEDIIVTQSDPPLGVTKISLPLYNVYRFVDTEAGVVCWICARTYNGDGGISCLPISETKLDE